eukprot:m.346483 g.346483  ORF g.346483 m.346483 type:complete len:169 (-) comp29381_c0_seq1:194-700(-)
MKTVILHLGGTLARGHKAVELLREHPGAILFVSSEGGDVKAFYSELGVSQEPIVDNEAWDTVTNFTYTYSRIKALHPDKIYVVTHDWHMQRAMAIAHAVWFGTNVELIPAHYKDASQRNESVWHDRLRAWLWRFTGILLYWKSTYERRVPHRKPRWNELAVSWLPFTI